MDRAARSTLPMVGRAVMMICVLSLIVSTQMSGTNSAQADTGKIHFITARGFCNDGIDNDGDGWIDYQDVILDCVPGPPPRPLGPEICGDGIDNDGNGMADRWDLGNCQVCYHAKTCPGGAVNPGDPSPIGPWDTHGLILSEGCLNGVDDDGDGIIDDGCRRGLWLLEYCGDNFDNNYDGRVDEPFDEDGVPCRPF
jgi:hypothetical protein